MRRKKQAPFFTLSLDCELTYPFDENATTLTYYLQTRLLACLDQVNRLARYLLKRDLLSYRLLLCLVHLAWKEAEPC